jgi:hypothetical protein
MKGRSIVELGWHAGHPPHPVPNTGEAIAEGRAHFVDHCREVVRNHGE